MQAPVDAQLAELQASHTQLAQMRESLETEQRKLRANWEQFAQMRDEELKKLQEESDRISRMKQELPEIPEMIGAAPTFKLPTTPEPLPMGMPKFHIAEHGYNPSQVDAYIDNLRAKEARLTYVNKQLFHLWMTEINQLSRTGGHIPIRRPADGSISWEEISWNMKQAFDLSSAQQPVPASAPADSAIEAATPTPPPKKRSRVRSIISGILFYSSLAVLIFGAVLFGVNDPTGPPVNIAGFSPMIVLTRSMQDEIPQDSLVITRRVDPHTIRVGDDITFLRQDNATVTHRVVDIRNNYQNTGRPGFQTQGTMNPAPDAEIVAAANVVGLVIFHSLFLGNAILFIRANIIVIVILTIVCAGFIALLKKIIYSENPKPKTPN